MSLTWTTGRFYLHFKRKKNEEKGAFISNCNGLKHDSKLVFTYSPSTWLQKEYVIWCKYLPIVKLAEQMSLTWTTERFYLHFKRKKNEEQGSFISNGNGLKHDSKLVFTYSPYTWLQKEYVIWCKYLPIVKLAEQMSLTWTTERFYLHFKRKKNEEQGSFISNGNGLKHDSKLVFTYSPYTWLQKEYVIWCKYLPIVKLAEQMSLTRTTGRY